jgi:predicted helicase
MSLDSPYFDFFSNGVVTSRGLLGIQLFPRRSLAQHVRDDLTASYAEVTRFAAARKKAGKAKLDPARVVDTNPKNISWSRSLLRDLEIGRLATLVEDDVVVGQYRPFNKLHLYFNRQFNETVSQVPKAIPRSNSENVAISVIGVADRKGFSVFITNRHPNLHLMDSGQCFPLYCYDIASSNDGDMFAASGSAVPVRRRCDFEQGFVIVPTKYRDAKLTKEDIFYYVYGVLHSPEYKERFSADLKKMLPVFHSQRASAHSVRPVANWRSWHLEYEVSSHIHCKSTAASSYSTRRRLPSREDGIRQSQPRGG